MQEVVLVIHLILAVTIIGLVLLQRSSGGGLGIGSSGGLGDFASARGAANALSKTTMILAFCFFGTSISLAVIAKHQGGGSGLLSDYKAEAPVMPAAPGTETPAETLATPAANEAAPAAPAIPEPPVSTE